MVHRTKQKDEVTGVVCSESLPPSPPTPSVRMGEQQLARTLEKLAEKSNTG